MYKIDIKKQADKTFEKMPENIQEKFRTLVADLKDKGPIRTEWSNYSTLGKNEHHCHLSRK